MYRYLLSRLLIVFFINFFLCWAINIKSQLINFFDFSSGFVLDALSYLLMFLIFVIGVFTVNIIFSVLHLSQEMSFNDLIQKIRNRGFLKSLQFYLRSFFTFLSENFETEFKLEKYPAIFLILCLIFLFFLKGNPILNNYYGIYTKYEYVNQGKYDEQTNFKEKQNYIIHKSKKNEIESRIGRLEKNIEDSDCTFEIKKRGYLFIQAGLIDGYETYYSEYKGFFSYLECLLFSVIEKIINVIMYFFIPFVIGIFLYHYKFDNKIKVKKC